MGVARGMEVVVVGGAIVKKKRRQVVMFGALSSLLNDTFDRPTKNLFSSRSTSPRRLF